MCLCARESQFYQQLDIILPRGRGRARTISETQTHFSLCPQLGSAPSQKGDGFASVPTFHSIYCTSLKGPLWGVKLFWKDVWSCALWGELKINRFLFTADLVVRQSSGSSEERVSPHKCCRPPSLGQSLISEHRANGFWQLPPRNGANASQFKLGNTWSVFPNNRMSNLYALTIREFTDKRSMTRFKCVLYVIKDSIFFLVVPMLSNPYVLIFQKPASKGVLPRTICCTTFTQLFSHLLHCHLMCGNMSCDYLKWLNHGLQEKKYIKTVLSFLSHNS